MNDDEKLSQGYRQLGAEEPPRHLDEAILAASRRAADARPAPLVAPAGRRRWYFPVAAAAVITLAVAVTWHMQLEEPDPYGYVASAPRQAPKEEAQALRKEDKLSENALPAKRRDAAPQPKPQTQQSPAPARAPEAAPQERRELEIGAMSGARAQAMIDEEPPEKTIERIADLRKQGKHEEADKLLEAFRKRYPDYKLPESVLRKR